jgi:Na+-transporting NADH:ubiquinone oxidoreductase subunit NqrD
MNHYQNHVFWGVHSPLSSLVGAGLLVMAGSRLSFAIVSAGALLWVYGFSALIFYAAGPLLPKKGRKIILLFLTSLLAGIYLLFLNLLNPLLTLSSFFFIILASPCCIGSGLFDNQTNQDPLDALSQGLQSAAVLGVLIIAMALIREPLGMGCLSLPGGLEGIHEFFSGDGTPGFIPIRILAASSGGLLILGYGVALYRLFRNGYVHTEEDEQ